MHPLIARFLDFPAAVAALQKDASASIDGQEAALRLAAAAFPKARSTILKAGATKKPSEDAQQQLIILSTRAASALLNEDAQLGPRVNQAKAALKQAGAQDDEIDNLIAQAVLEEAFGYAEDPGIFDGDYVGETLDSLSHLAVLTQETIDDWLETFARGAPSSERPLRLKVAELVLESAWSEGPQPMTPEHLDDALEQLADSVAESEVEKASATVAQFLTFLAERKVIGKERFSRLEHVLKSATARGLEPNESDEDDDEDDDA